MSLDLVAGRIVNMEPGRRLLVAIDGGSAAGKSRLRDELAVLVESQGRPVILASIDDFHRPRVERYSNGRYSGLGCYEDTFDYTAVQDALLKPLSAGGDGCYVTAWFDAFDDKPVVMEPRQAPRGAVLLMDGVWLQREQLAAFWDLVIFVQADLDVAKHRGVLRDTGWGVPIEEAEMLYKLRYIPADLIYFERVRPAEIADVVIENTDFRDRYFSFH